MFGASIRINNNCKQSYTFLVQLDLQEIISNISLSALVKYYDDFIVIDDGNCEMCKATVQREQKIVWLSIGKVVVIEINKMKKLDNGSFGKCLTLCSFQTRSLFIQYGFVL